MPTVDYGYRFREVWGVDNGFNDAAVRVAQEFRSRVASLNSAAGNIVIDGATYRAYTDLTTPAGVRVEAVMLPGEPNTVYLRTCDYRPVVLAVITFDAAREEAHHR